MILAGFPPITTLSPKLLVTTAPAATTTLFPKVTPGTIVALPPIQQLSPIVIGLPNSVPLILSLASSGWVAVYIPTCGATKQLSPILISQTSKNTQL